MTPAASAPHIDIGRRRVARSLVFLVAISVAWTALLSNFREGNIYFVLGPFALAIVAWMATRHASRLRKLLAPRPKSVLLGLGVGVVMTAATYPVFELLVSWLPWLEPRVASLYAGAAQGWTPWMLVWLVLIVIAEEAIWRGRWISVLEKKLSPPVVLAISVAIYALCQLGSGSPLVALLALVCGVVWGLLRQLTEGLVAPLLAHLIFTLTVIAAHPVV